MNSKIKHSLKMDLSELPTDVIPHISAYLTDSTILNESLRSRRAISPGGTVGWLWNLRSEWTTRRLPNPRCTRKLSSPTTIGLNRNLPDVQPRRTTRKRGDQSLQSGPPTRGRCSRNGTPRRGQPRGTPQPCRLGPVTTTQSSWLPV
jgi:hypothetical protein